jgi:hypothetical protein
VKSTGTKGFWKLYAALPPQIKQAAREAYQKFKSNPAHPSLRLERLKSEPRAWSVRITRDYRAVAQRFSDDEWIWVWIGSHEQFDQAFKR